MVRKHYYNFSYSANMLKIRSGDLTVHNAVMLIKFSKQIAKSFAKKNEWLQREIQNPDKHLRWRFFHEVVTGFRGKLRMLPKI